MMPPPRPRPAVIADAAEIAAVHVDSWRETYAGMLPDPFLASMDVEDYEDRWLRTLQDPYQRSVVHVAEEDGRVVGFASSGRERDDDPRYDGELYAIYLREAAQGRGHGRGLVAAAADSLALRGMTSMVVWVLRANAHARGFYERLGGVYLRQRPLDLGIGLDIDVPEVSYLWTDTAALREPAWR